MENKHFYNQSSWSSERQRTIQRLAPLIERLVASLEARGKLKNMGVNRRANAMEVAFDDLYNQVLAESNQNWTRRKNKL
jgi:hypothetical protein